MYTVFLAILCLLLTLIALFYFQMPMFIPKLPLSWLTNYAWKRMAIRIIALLFFLLFFKHQDAIWQLALVGIPFITIWVCSFFLKSDHLFKALSAKNIIKNNSPYPNNVEVIGYISQNNVAVCYPIYEMVSPRHIINDEIDSDKIMLTYCPACGSCMVFKRMIQGRELHFQVANGIYRRNMLMLDHETKSIWQQNTGECIEGALKGSQLEFLPYQQMTSEEWLKSNPSTQFIYEKEDAPKALFSQNKIANFMKKLSAIEGPPNKNSKKLAFNEKVWGLEINGYSKAYPVSELKKITQLTDKIGNVEIEINFNSQTKKIDGKEMATRKPLKFQFHWWIGWVEFHPNTEVWKVN